MAENKCSLGFEGCENPHSWPGDDKHHAALRQGWQQGHDHHADRVLEMQARLVVWEELLAKLRAERGSLETQLQAAQEALAEYMGEMREICRILRMGDGDDKRSGIELAKICRLSFELAEPLNTRLRTENAMHKSSIKGLFAMIARADGERVVRKRALKLAEDIWDSELGWYGDELRYYEKLREVKPDTFEAMARQELAKEESNA